MYNTRDKIFVFLLVHIYFEGRNKHIFFVYLEFNINVIYHSDIYLLLL